MDRIQQLEAENEKLRNELIETKEHLKRYTCPVNSKIYYENNREKHIQQVREYRERTNYVQEIPSEKKKQYARTAYLNRKEKLKKLKEVEEKDTCIL